MDEPVPPPTADAVERLEARRALTAALRKLHHAAGLPTIRELAAQVVNAGGRISHVAVHSMLSGNNVPRWENLDQVVRALHGDPQELRSLWEAASARRITPVTAPAARLNGEGGREFRVAWNLERDRRHSVAELVEGRGLVVAIGDLERWQAYAIVAILEPPFKE